MAAQFASRLSLIAFATTAVRGAMGGDDFFGALQTALIAAILFYGLGLVFGDLARRVVEDNARLELHRIVSRQVNSTSEDESSAA